MFDLQKSPERDFAPLPKFSIIVPTWNNLDYLKLLVRSLRDNSIFHHQIIVAINEGADGTLDWVKAQSDLDWLFSEKNIGICYALNACRPLVRAEYLVYFNDDMYACPGWDKVLFDEIEKIGHRNFFLSSTMIEPMDTGNPCVIVRDFGNSIENFQEKQLLEVLCSSQSVIRNPQSAIEKADWSGATWPPNIVHLDLWDLVGGLSVEFSPGMYSDPDFSKKLWEAGVRYFKGMGESRVYHFGSKSTRRLGRSRGSDLFLKKWGMTAGTFGRYFLKRGEDWTGGLGEVELGFFMKMKDRLKRIF